MIFCEINMHFAENWRNKQVVILVLQQKIDISVKVSSSEFVIADNTTTNRNLIGFSAESFMNCLSKVFL